MEGSIHAKTSSIRPVVSMYTDLWRTDGRTHNDSVYRASIASRGKNKHLYAQNSEATITVRVLTRLIFSKNGANQVYPASIDGQTGGRTDGRTDTRLLHRPAPRSMRAASITTLSLEQRTVRQTHGGTDIRPLLYVFRYDRVQRNGPESVKHYQCQLWGL